MFSWRFDLHSTLAIAPSQVPTLQFPLSSLLSSPPPPSHCRLTDILPPPPSHCQFEYGFGIFFCILSLEDVVAVVLDSVKSSSFDRGKFLPTLVAIQMFMGWFGFWFCWVSFPVHLVEQPATFSLNFNIFWGFELFESFEFSLHQFKYWNSLIEELIHLNSWRENSVSECSCWLVKYWHLKILH